MADEIEFLGLLTMLSYSVFPWVTIVIQQPILSCFPSSEERKDLSFVVAHPCST